MLLQQGLYKFKCLATRRASSSNNIRSFSSYQNLEASIPSLYLSKHQQVEFRKPILLGLGNSLIENYEISRHNVGNMYLQYLAKSKNLSLKKVEFGEIGESEHFVIVKSSIKMNESGIAAEALQEMFGLTQVQIQEHLVVLTDNLDTKLGKAKFKIGGSALGHNGIKSIQRYFRDSLDFKKVLIGISKPDSKDGASIINHVMGNFERHEIAVLEKEAYAAVDRILVKNILEEYSTIQGQGRKEKQR